MLGRDSREERGYREGTGRENGLNSGVRRSGRGLKLTENARKTHKFLNFGSIRSLRRWRFQLEGEKN